MKILITGGAGFIGSHLSEAYLQKGDEVYIIDDLSTGSLENTRHFQEQYENGGQLFVTIDSVMNYDKMVELIGTCDVVFHLAAAVGVQYILDNPLSSLITNVRGTEIVLELCAKFRKKVIIASTSEVYGKRQHSPLSETDDSVYGPSTKSRWSYAASKLMDEFLALAYWRSRKLPAIIVRFFNTVGPRQTGRYGMVIPRFVTQAMKGLPITVYGAGAQTRTFTHVREVIESLLRLVETPDAVGEVVNIGGVEEVSILNLAGRIKDRLESPSEIQLLPYDEVFPEEFEDMDRRVPSTEKLQSLIGYHPTMSLDEILEDIIEFYQSHQEQAQILIHEA